MPDFSYAKVSASMIEDAADDMQDVLETVADRYEKEKFSDQEEMMEIVSEQLSDIREDIETIESVLKEVDES